MVQAALEEIGDLIGVTLAWRSVTLSGHPADDLTQALARLLARESSQDRQ